MPLHFLEHHEHDSAGAGDKTDAPGGKRAHRDNLLIIAGTFGVLIVTYLVYRSSKATASSSAAAAARPSASYPAAGNVVGAAGSAGAGDASYLQQIAQQVQSSLDANTQAQAQAQAGFAQYLDQLTAHLVDMNQPSSPTASTGNPPASSSAPNAWKLVYTPGIGAGVDTGQRDVSSGPVGAGAPSPDFANFRAQQPADVQHFLDAVGSGQVVIQNGVVYGHT